MWILPNSTSVIVKGAELSPMKGINLGFAPHSTSFLSKNGWKKFFIFDILVTKPLILSSVQIQNIPQWKLCSQCVRRLFRVTYALFKGFLSVLFCFLIMTLYIEFMSLSTTPFPWDSVFLIQGDFKIALARS